jgi:bifunctional UDP-N-acetylglucosamine pyrophosphorylase/glucosamine-1-phosphate N-acetyltransferase
MKNNYEVSVVIAAAGKGSRSGLDYPKCLYKINNIPIIVRIIRSLIIWDNEPAIIVSPEGEGKIEKTLSENNLKSRLIIQPQAKGMGDAILMLKKHTNHLKDNILLTWGDLPFIERDSVKALLHNYFISNDDFRLLTSIQDNPYTVVVRDGNGNIKEVLETRESQIEIPPQSNERDIGVFIFKKDLLMDYLSRNLPNKFGQTTNEHGFLYVLKHLVANGYKVSATRTLNDIESVSFNSLSDIEEYDK